MHNDFSVQNYHVLEDFRLGHDVDEEDFDGTNDVHGGSDCCAQVELEMELKFI